MPHRNRVAPDATIVRAPYRGRWMGNRGGPLPDDPGRRPWASRAWIYCRLDFNGRRRVFREPGRRYTELFFFDETHALAAGHRPCGECQHHRLRDFKVAAGFAVTTSVAAIDRRLHEQRTGAERQVAVIGSLPDGAFVVHAGQPALLWDSGMHRWDPERGYAPIATPAADTRLVVLTPPTIVTALAGGFTVEPALGQ
ncbi:hypothetical protein [Millisia brevis]|uniref:hypothetical protein n=1 Tax=Millisia brevis TaxID=264148 RepID=UPI00082CFD01|nr:hypothetical protein [Millisia brevis]